MEDWVTRLIYELADLDVKVLSLQKFLRNNSAGVVNKGDDMYGVMEEQLRFMKSYRATLEERVSIVRVRAL